MRKSIDFASVFSRTLSQLEAAEAHQLREEFLQNWGMDHLHFFPMFLRQNQYPAAVVEAADYEFQIYSLNEQDLRFRKPEVLGQLMLNPSCQFLRIHSAAWALGKAAGLYAIWKSNDQVQEKILNLQEAALLDLLREDLPVYEQELSIEERKTLSELQALNLVWRGEEAITSPAQPY